MKVNFACCATATGSRPISIVPSLPSVEAKEWRKNCTWHSASSPSGRRMEGSERGWSYLTVASNCQSTLFGIQWYPGGIVSVFSPCSLTAYCTLCYPRYLCELYSCASRYERVAYSAATALPRNTDETFWSISILGWYWWKLTFPMAESRLSN